MNKLYSRINWENEVTPLNESNLNKMDGALNDLDNRVIEQSNLKADKADINSTIVNVNIDEDTGIITFTRYNGTTIKFDTKLEKLVTTARYDSDKQQIVLVLEDGSELQIDVSALITQYEFEDSATIRFSVVGGKVSASIINGSIKESMLDSSIMAKIAVYVSNSAQNATTAVNSASEAKTAANEAKASADAAAESEANAKIYAENAKAIAGIGIATADTAGLMRGGDNYVDESGALVLTRETTDSTLLNSYAGGLKINSVSGKNTQVTTTGKNMWNPNGFTDVVVDSAGTMKRGIKVDVAGTYTFSFASKGTGIYYVYYSDLAGFVDTKEVTNFTVTIYEYDYFVIYADSDEILQTFVEPQLESGSEATAYEPFTGGMSSPSTAYQQEIESVVVGEIKARNKNLLRLEDGNYTAYGITISRKNGIVSFNGTTEKRVTTTIGNQLLAKGTYIFSQGVSTSNTCSLFLQYEQNGTQKYVDLNQDEDGAISFELTEDTSIIIRADVRSAGVTVNNFKLYPMISAVGGEYEPYEETTVALSEPITLNGVGSAKDRIVKKDGVWGVERNFKEVVLYGSIDENWSIVNAGTENAMFMYAVSDKARNNNSLCSHFISADITSSTTNIGFSTFSVNDNVCFRPENAETWTLEAWKAWLAENPMTVVYELATSTFEELPEVDQIALHGLPTYADVTYVVTDSEVEAVIEKEYGTSKVGAYALETYNGMKRNEIKINVLMALTNDLSAAVVAGSEG